MNENVLAENATIIALGILAVVVAGLALYLADHLDE